VFLALFLLAESRAESPIIPLNLFRVRTFTLIGLASIFIGASFFAAILFLSIYLVNVLGVSATSAGTTLIPLTLGLVASSIVSSQVVQRTGKYKVMILGGLLATAAGFWWLATMDPGTTLNGVRLRMVVLGLGLGPSLPILTLAIQNAVPFENVGAATAGRQFFQQLGQMLGAAIFGAILTSTLTTALAANLEPIKAKLPPEFAQQLDTNRLRNGTGGEGAGGEQIAVEQRIEQQIRQSFAEQRDLITRALRDNDPPAVLTLLSNPQTPGQLRETLQAGGIAALVDRQIEAQKEVIGAALRSGDPDVLQKLLDDPGLPQQLKDNLAAIPPQALSDPQAADQIAARIGAALDEQKPALVQTITDQALAQANAALDAAEADAVAGGVETGREIDTAIKSAFSTSVTNIYGYAIPLILVAFALLLFVPELPLRRSNQPAAPALD
jgi:hypothetical protein